jgi:hypothetical protein
MRLFVARVHESTALEKKFPNQSDRSAGDFIKRQQVRLLAPSVLTHEEPSLGNVMDCQTRINPDAPAFASSGFHRVVFA